MFLAKRSCAVVLIAAILACLSGLPVVALESDDLETRRQEMQDLEKRRRDERSALDFRLNREAALKEELDQLEELLRELRSELDRLAGEIAVVKDEISLVESELSEAEERMILQEELLNLRLRAIQQHGLVSYIEVLLESSNFSDFLTRLHNLSMIASNDLRLIEEIRAERELIAAWKADLEEKKVSLENMRNQAAVNEAEMERAARDRQDILVELQEEIAANIAAIESLEIEAQKLDEQIRRLISEATSHFSGIEGVLYWPIEAPTRLTSGYGWRNDPFTGAQAWHGGIDVAPYGGSANYILAAADGTVIFSGWNGGYGNCIMIDHGGGTVTLYGHMSSMQVQVGAVVSRGQRIARAGTTGYSTGVHLHFEVREYDRPAVRSYPGGGADHRYNPLNYF